MDKYTKVANALAALGDTAEDVASRLAQEGCFGEPHAHCGCPLARFVNGLGCGAVAVGIMHVHFISEITSRGVYYEPFSVLLTDATSDFRWMFDQWRFPALRAR